MRCLTLRETILLSIIIVAVKLSYQTAWCELECAVPHATCSNDFSFRTYDGSCNNLQYLDFGMAKSRYSRILKPNYGDGVSAPSKSASGRALPSPRILSLSLYGEQTIPDSHRSMMTLQFGQIVIHDISSLVQPGSMGDCCANTRHKMCYPIYLYSFGPITMATGKTCLHFARALSDRDVACPPSDLPYVEKITASTAYLDLSSIYGNSLQQNAKIRQFKHGLLKTSWINSKPFLPIQSWDNPRNSDQCYSIPDHRNQISPLSASLHTIFVREHNRLANILTQINPHFTDERIFQLARRINIAQFQKITYYDWIPFILSPIYAFKKRLLVPRFSLQEYVNDYNSLMNPAPLAEATAGALRYFHHMIPGWFSMISSEHNNNQTLRLRDYFNCHDSMKLLMYGNNLDSLIRGLVTQPEKRADDDIAPEIKHFFDVKPLDIFGFDLKSIDIQRSRDFGLASYNDMRVYCGLTRASEWSDFLNTIPGEKIELLKKFYESPNDVELIIGGSLEKHESDALVGPTFQCIIGQQFLNTRTGDRYFYENENSGFTPDQLAAIRNINLASILCANSNNLEYIQPNVFLLPSPQNDLIKCDALPQLDLRLWKDNFVYY